MEKTKLSTFKTKFLLVLLVENEKFTIIYIIVNLFVHYYDYNINETAYCNIHSIKNT